MTNENKSAEAGKAPACDPSLVGISVPKEMYDGLWRRCQAAEQRVETLTAALELARKVGEYDWGTSACEGYHLERIGAMHGMRAALKATPKERSRREVVPRKHPRG